MGRQLLKHREALLAVVIIMMIGAIGSRAPSFITPGNLVEMFNDTAILIILALGQMMVLLTKGIDLSMAANLALTGMIVALLNAHYPGIPVAALLALATLLGLLMGMINGLLVWRLGIPAIVVTLGTMSIYRGIIFLLSDGGWVNSHQMSADFLGLPRASLLGLPLLSWCAIAALLLVGYFLRYSRTGRALYTAGGNATAAYYTGINAGKMQFVSFCLSGALAGFCGYLWISRFAVAYVDVANGFELQIVAACVIGGVSFVGGTGKISGIVVGVLLAILVNQKDLRFKPMIRTIFILPWAVPGFVTILVFAGMFNDSFGVINNAILSFFGITPKAWLTDPFWTKSALIMMQTWLGFPFVFAMTTGVLQAIPDDLYEAATMDGASAFTRLRTITLPLVLYSIAPIIITQYTFNFNNFNIIYLFNNGGPAVAGSNAGGTDILVSWIYKLTMSSSQYAIAATITILLSIFVVGLALWQFRATKSFKNDDMA